MGVFRQFPYSNFHEMNMDEIIKVIKNMLEEWAQYYAEWDAWMSEINEDWDNYQRVMDEAWENMRTFINNYFDNLDVQNEINNKITSMVNSGEFVSIVAPYIPARVTEWLTANITQPVGVVIDTSLTVAGACADAKATGDAIQSVKNDLYGTEFSENIKPLFESGSFESTTGNEVSSTTRIRTLSYIDDIIQIITTDPSYYAILYAWQNNTYIGAWSGSDFTTNYLNFAHLTTIKLYEFRENYSGYDFKIIIARNDSGTINISEGDLQTYYSLKIDRTLTIPLYAADSKTVGDKFDSIDNQIELIKNPNYNGYWLPFVYPVGFNGSFTPVDLFTNGTQWKTNYDKENWKNTDVNAKTYYVSTDGVYTNDGLTRNKPIPLYQAITRAVDGDTIILLEGDYRNDTVSNIAVPTITKSINIIGEGKVRYSKSAMKTPIYDPITGVYRVSQNAMQGVYDPELDIYYKPVLTIEDCQNTPYSIYFGAMPDIFINCGYQHDILAVFNDLMFVIDATSNDVQFYMENIELLGGGVCFSTRTASPNDCLIICDHCTFTYNVGALGSVCRIESAKTIFNKCVARYSQNDGFAYAITPGGSDTGFVEIDCVAYNNGFYSASESSNGSTAHSGYTGIRINGKYYESTGGNVVDVHNGTQTINCGCAAFNSKAPSPGYNEGFGIQQAGAEQWLYNCVAFGNFYDFFGVPSTTINAEKCCHKTDNFDSSYHGTLNDNNPKDLDVIIYENKAMQIN